MQLEGHRERKKQRTRDAIEQAAIGLFLERGYDATTLAEIADAAGVSTRTIFAYFASKEDILFGRHQALAEALAAALVERPGGKDALGTLRDFVVDVACEKSEIDVRLERMVAGHQILQSHQRARFSELQGLLATAIADDLGSGPGDLRPQIAAASLTAAFELLAREDTAVTPPYTPEQIAAEVDPIIAFVRAGLEALPAPARR